MRHIFLTFAITAATTLMAASSFAAGTIEGWEDSIPVSQIDTSAQIDNKAYDLVYEDEGNYIGGQAWDYKLVDLFTYEDNDGALTYNVRIQYRASMTLDYGRTETTRVCQSLVVIDPKLNVSVGAIECPDIGNAQPATF